MPEDPPKPWKGTKWEKSAEAANNGLQGQGFVVHAAMRAARSNTRLTVAIIVLMVVQIGIALAQVRPWPSESRGGAAWVLWVVTSMGDSVLPEAPMSAFTTKPECERALGEQIAKMRLGGGKVTVTEGTVLVWDKSGSKVATSSDFACLPDTVDPRGLKGK